MMVLGILIQDQGHSLDRSQSYLSANSGYLLGWSDEDKQIGGEDTMKLGAPLESANNLYYDLQMQYKQISRLLAIYE